MSIRNKHRPHHVVIAERLFGVEGYVCWGCGVNLGLFEPNLGPRLPRTWAQLGPNLNRTWTTWLQLGPMLRRCCLLYDGQLSGFYDHQLSGFYNRQLRGFYDAMENR